ARLRRWVTGVIAAAAVVTVMVSARALIAYAHPAPPADNSLSMSRPVVPSIAATDEPAAVAPAAAAPAAEPAIAASASSGGRPAFAASAAASARSAVPTPTKREARKLIERGRMKEGIVAARAAVGADPTDAETYLLLGAALQELGQWKESMAIFTQCVATATNGPVAECRALRGR
ncbi:MAG TPA: hypothetical protein VJT73_06865, partial [Polyangiaceae bacterium]|nr:hypothetical protein [Polyangiaceae bacterium]